MPQFFIKRPIFAWVIALLICLGGVIAISQIGVESYPSIAPPQIMITATYPGASAQALEASVTQVIEQQLTGIDHLLYFSSSSSANGQATITLTFESNANADIAQVQVQNKVSLASPHLPREVTQQGVVVAKANAGFLMVVALRSSNPTIHADDLNDLVASRVIDQIARVPGVGNVRQFGAEYAMNVWLNPQQLQGFGLSAAQVYSAITTQNSQFAAGSLGADPALNQQAFTAAVSAEGRLDTVDAFKQIILHSNTNGSAVHLSDVAQVGIGTSNYGIDNRYNGQASGAFAIQLLPGANALTVAQAVRDKMATFDQSFPQGVSWFVPYDSTGFVTVAIHEVVETLGEAIVLVFFVMLIFLQNFRATIIPTLVIPVALLGTFLGMWALNFTINQLTLFAMVLAIGIVVDDAIVVIENVERIMSDEKISALKATQKAMHQITGAIIAITVVLAAVFIPSALQPGAAGAIYKQFSITIAIAMGFSAFLALSFTPALCATMLKSTHASPSAWIFRFFNTCYDWLSARYLRIVDHSFERKTIWVGLAVILFVICGYLYQRLPTSFLPEEDQGFILALVQLPSGATKERTGQVFDQMRGMAQNIPEIEGVLQVTGFSFLGAGENVGLAFIKLKPWDERKRTVEDLIPQINGMFFQIRGAQIFAVNLPTVQGLGQFGGFDFWLQDRANNGRNALEMAKFALLKNAAQHPESMVAVRPNGLDKAPQIQLHTDRLYAQTMGVSVQDIYTTIQMMLAPNYVNDFLYQGRIKRVTMRADAPFRMGTEAFNQYYLPSSTQKEANGLPSMIPLSTLVKPTWVYQSPSLSRFNGYAAEEIVGNVPPGGSSGHAMSIINDIVNHDLAKGFGLEWAGMSYQELLAGSAASLLLALSIVIVFLCLAALYESWSIPFSVLLVVPIGVLGALLFMFLRGLSNDIYFKISLITVIGLAAKNAILIVEFAVEQSALGHSLRKSAFEAARLRFRPVLMTSFAFIMGVFPLAISTGAGANSRHAIGTGVIGGMVFATTLGLFFIPLFFVCVRQLFGHQQQRDSQA